MESKVPVRFRGVSKVYGDRRVLDTLDIDVRAGEVLGYVGPNGAGKSTTLKILAGIVADYYGVVEVCGHDMRREGLKARQRIGYVPETADLYDALSPAEFLMFVGRMRGLDSATVERRGRELMASLGMAERYTQVMRTFSRGMRQKVLICAATLHDPDVLVLDEALSGLDAGSVIVLKKIMVALARQGKAVMYSSHLLDVVEKVSDRIVVINKGQIVASGTPDEIRSRSAERSFEAVFQTLVGKSTTQANADDFVSAMRA